MQILALTVSVDAFTLEAAEEKKKGNSYRESGSFMEKQAVYSVLTFF